MIEGGTACVCGGRGCIETVLSETALRAAAKRLRMVRTRHEAPSGVRFERAEVDGRDHSPWVLEADVAAHPDGSELTMRLHYGGGLFGPVLERVLRDEIERSRLRLLALVSDPTDPAGSGAS